MKLPKHYSLVPPDEILTRLESMGRSLAGVCPAALISWPADLFYYSGSNQAGYLLLSPEADPVFLVRRSPERAEAETPVPVLPLNGLNGLAGLIRDHLGFNPDGLGLALDVTPHREATHLAGLLGRAEPVDISGLIMTQRSIKSDWEIGQMAKAGRLHARLMAAIPEMFHPGMTEVALAGAVTGLFMSLGGQAYMRTRRPTGEMYPWHLVAGDRTLLTSRVEAPFGGLGTSPSFPQGSSNQPIAPGEMILVDYGCCWDGYMVDVTRMFCSGPPPERGLAAYRALEEIENWILERLMPGANGREIYEGSLKLADKLGFGTEFLGQGRSAITFVGHGVGLEFGEPPYLAVGRNDIVAKGQTLALELKMVLPGLGSVGLENTVAVTETGPVKLSTADEAFIVI